MIFAGSFGRHPRRFHARRSRPAYYYPQPAPIYYVEPAFTPTCVRVPSPTPLPACAGTWVNRDARTVCCLPAGFAGAAAAKPAAKKSPRTRPSSDTQARTALWQLVKRGFYAAAPPPPSGR